MVSDGYPPNAHRGLGICRAGQAGAGADGNQAIWDIRTALTPANLAVAADLLIPSVADLNRKLRYPRLQEAQDLVKRISRAIVPEPIAFGSLLEENVEGEDEVAHGGDWVSTGDPALDEALGGGLRVGTITELSGERCVSLIWSFHADVQCFGEVTLLPHDRPGCANPVSYDSSRRHAHSHLRAGDLDRSAIRSRGVHACST